MRLFFGFALALLVGFSLWAHSHISIFEEMRTAPKLYWGTQALVDLYIGFVLVSIVYFKIEKTKLAALIWMLLTFVFGNIASLVYLIAKFEKVQTLLSSKAADPR